MSYRFNGNFQQFPNNQSFSHNQHPNFRPQTNLNQRSNYFNQPVQQQQQQNVRQQQNQMNFNFPQGQQKSFGYVMPTQQPMIYGQRFYVIPPTHNQVPSLMSMPIPDNYQFRNFRPVTSQSSSRSDGHDTTILSSTNQVLESRTNQESSLRRNDESSKKKHPKKWKKSDRPWRGFVVEDIYRKRNFRTVGHSTCYTQYMNKNTNRKEVAVTESLLELHKRFIKHRLCLDDGGSSPNKERVHEDIPLNSPNEENTCNCSDEHKEYGIHHNIFPITQSYKKCDPYKRDTSLLHHYRVVISPETNFVTRDPTTIYFDGRDFCFEGYSLYSHESLDKLPPLEFTRYNIEYKVELIKDDYISDGFCMKDLDLICDYLFQDVMELYDWCQSNSGSVDTCKLVHFMPRFVHRSTAQGEDTTEKFEILSMSEVFEHCIESVSPIIETHFLNNAKPEDWKDFAKGCNGCLVINSKKKPRVIRMDDIVRSKGQKDPVFHHSTPSLKFHSKESKKEYAEAKDLLNKAICAVKSRENARKEDLEILWKRQSEFNDLREKRLEQKFSEVEVNCAGYFKIGLRWDLCQHCSYLPSLLKHIKYIISLQSLQTSIKYNFKDISLLKTALTHPSYVEERAMSTQVSHMLQNLGKQYPRTEKADRSESTSKKKGLVSYVDTIATLLDNTTGKSRCLHNERMEFLGDSILDYICSFHLFLMFANKTPGELTEFRASLVQAVTLESIGKNLKLHHYLLVNHRYSDMSYFNNYIGNAVEALTAAIYLDSGLKEADEFLSHILFPSHDLVKVWRNLKPHPLQEGFPDGDRHMLAQNSNLQKFVELEESVGVKFKHVRLLVKAFTLSGLHNMKVVNGDYQRLEFLGDAVLKFLVSDFLYKKYPNHQEGHLTLLRSSLENARCLSIVSNELNFPHYLRRETRNSTDSGTIPEKVASDLFESFLGALRIDKDMKHCRAVVNICLLSRLEENLISQEWFDSKSQLSHLFDKMRKTQRSDSESVPSHPIYKRLKERVIDNVRQYRVGVYYKNRRLATGDGTTIKEAEKAAAREALKKHYSDMTSRGRTLTRRMRKRSRQSREKSRSSSPQRKRQHTEHTESPSEDESSNQRFSPERREHESDDGAETLESSEGEEETNEEQLYDTVFNI